MDTKLADQAIVTAEYAIDDERRIDIVIEIGSYFLPIEVKIYAADRKASALIIISMQKEEMRRRKCII